uniref:Putative secreted protein n=1 Tax=Anopheles marajoara TaxID=58244 RepID=A0A2M4C719_9DIPT
MIWLLFLPLRHGRLLCGNVAAYCVGLSVGSTAGHDPRHTHELARVSSSSTVGCCRKMTTCGHHYEALRGPLRWCAIDPHHHHLLIGLLHFDHHHDLLLRLLLLYHPRCVIVRLAALEHSVARHHCDDGVASFAACSSDGAMCPRYGRPPLSSGLSSACARHST